VKKNPSGSGITWNPLAAQPKHVGMSVPQVLQPLAEAKCRETRLFFTKTRTLIKSVREWDHMESTNSPAKACWDECPPGAPTIGRGKIQRNASFFYKTRTLIKSVREWDHMESTNSPAKACWGECPPGAPTIGRGKIQRNASFFYKNENAHKIRQGVGSHGIH